MTVDTLQMAIRQRYRFEQKAVLTNVFVLRSPWESDAIYVTKAGFWAEFEIKLTRSDFLADFRKSQYGVNKHEAYAAQHEIRSGSYGGSLIPKPKHFWFVCPEGVVTNDDIPPHAGLMTLVEERTRLLLKIEKQAPALKKPTKLSYEALWNLTAKAASKAR